MGHAVSPIDLLPAPEPVQLLDPDGSYREHEAYPFDLDDQQLRGLMRLMRLTRAIDREAINLQRQGQLGVYASCLGQEAAQIGSAAALSDQDWIFPSYRELGPALLRDMDPAKLLHLYRGTWLSDHDPHEYGYALVAIPIGTQALHAAGFAMGAKLDKSDVVTLAYFGDGATSEGDTHEALNFAAVFEAPCVFFVQNNQYAISVPLDRQTRAPSLAHKAIGYGMPGYRCDGNDVLASYAVTKRAVDAARAGHGPALIEAMTYRMEAHTTSDDPTRYRTQNELDEAALYDPLIRFDAYLRSRDLIDDAFIAGVDEEARDRAGEMRSKIYEAPHDDPQELFDHVYVTPPPQFDDQRKQLAEELAANDVARSD